MKPPIYSLSFVIALLGLSIAPLHASVDMFLKIDGVAGESTDASHQEEIIVENFTSSVLQRGLDIAGESASQRKTQFKTFTIYKQIDKASPLLMLACATGKHFPTVKLSVRDSKRTNNPEYFHVILTDVTLANIDTGAASADGTLLESLSLNFTKIEFQYKQDVAGASDLIATYDLKAAKK